MSIINKMHQDLQQVQQTQPILAAMPEKGSKQKALLLLAIALLLGSSFVFAALIFTQEKSPAVMQSVKMQAAEPELPAAPKVLSSIVLSDIVSSEIAPNSTVQKKPRAEPLRVEQAAPNASPGKVLAPAITVNNGSVEKQKTAEPEKISLPSVSTEIASVNTAAVNEISVEPAPAKEPKSEEQQLDIKVSQLSAAQLAQIHMKDADKAQAQGDFELAVKKNLRALALQPGLNELRKSVALYYYGQGDVNSAQRLLKQGVLASPDYPDFNLMLSRIALKEGEQHKAYLYLEQNPPQVEGNLDYYASHAILAQKFQKYEQSESLYRSLLSQRPNNGRWRMSLAIVQDRQDKIDLAVNNYKKALLQTDLSAKAKVYINQRLAYLGQH